MECDLSVTDLWYYMNSRAIFRKGIDCLNFLAVTQTSWTWPMRLMPREALDAQGFQIQWMCQP